MSNPSLYFHTLRHLKPGQISSRLLRRINGRAVSLSAPASPAPRVLSTAAPWLGRPPQSIGGFTFLNLKKEFPAGRIDWRSAEMPKLWRYNLHYFDYLLDPARPLDDRCRLIDDWIASNPSGAPDAWVKGDESEIMIFSGMAARPGADQRLGAQALQLLGRPHSPAHGRGAGPGEMLFEFHRVNAADHAGLLE